MDTGTKVYRNYFPITFGTQLDCQYGRAYPVFRKIMYPGDVFKVHADLLIRYQPLQAPPMNNATATVRFFFVPLRLVVDNIELIMTGSKDGHLSEETLPVCDSVFKYLDLSYYGTRIEKHSILDIMYGIPTFDMVDNTLRAKLDASKASPAAYFAKAYLRCWWDYYRDENLFTAITDFESFWNSRRNQLHKDTDNVIRAVNLRKDRITSSLPWQLKAVVPPTIEIVGSGTMTPNFDSSKFINVERSPQQLANIEAQGVDGSSEHALFTAFTSGSTSGIQDIFDTQFDRVFNTQQNVNVQIAGFDAAKFRDMMAQTRVFERLARTGSRYTEYLRANFGVAPSDDTLQRAVYLGGFKTHIVTTEVIQTAGDGNSPVGTLRGHGITHGTSTIKSYMAKEPGVMIGILDVKPETIYAQGVDRELTYRSRFDFLNPSFQHLSEQEVRKGEVYFGTDVDENGNLKNDETWGFQPYAEELRKGVKHVVGDMRDSLSFWNQALIFSSRPSLNQAFLAANNHNTSYNRPFVVTDVSAYPMVVDFGGVIEAYRPLVKNGTPGLVDHN